MKPQEENELAKMFLMGHDTYDKLNDQLKEISTLRTLNDEMKDVLKAKTGDGGNQDKWLNYRNKMVKFAEKKRDTNEQTENISNLLKKRHVNNILDNLMKKITNSSRNKKKIPDKWLRYRDLLIRRALLKKLFSDEKDKGPAEYKKRINSVKLLNSELEKILKNRKLRNNDKWLRYRNLLYKNNLHKPHEDDIELYHAIWADKHNRHRKNIGIQTTPPSLPVTPINSDETPTSSLSFLSDKSDFATPQSSNRTNFTTQQSTKSPALKEVIYTIDSSSDGDKSLSPGEAAAEHEKQRKYLSTSLHARRLLNERDIRNNTTDIDPVDIDDIDTEYQHRTYLTDQEQKQLEPLKYTNKRKIGDVSSKKIKKLYIYDKPNSSNRLRPIQEFALPGLKENTAKKVKGSDGGYARRRLEYNKPSSSSTATTTTIANESLASLSDFNTPHIPSSSTPHTSKKQNSINTGTLKDHFKVVKKPKRRSPRQGGAGRSKNILRWESYR